MSFCATLPKHVSRMVAIFFLFTAASAGHAAITFTNPAALNSNATTDTGQDFYPRIATDRDDTYVVVWQSRNTVGGPAGSDYDIFFSRTTDDGAVWSNVATLNDGASADTAEDEHPDIATDGTTWIAVWESNRSAGTNDGTDTDIFFSRSTNGGATWSAAAPIHSNATSDLVDDDRDARIFTDRAGTWICAWSSEAQLVNNGQFDSDIMFVRSTNDGQTWSAPAYLNSNSANATGQDFAPYLGVGHDGTWVAVWGTTDTLGKAVSPDNDLLYARSTNDGQTWSTAAFLNADAATDQGEVPIGNDAGARVAQVGAEKWIATWHRFFAGGAAAVYSVESTDDGQTWSPKRVLDDPSGVGKAAASSASDMEWEFDPWDLPDPEPDPWFAFDTGDESLPPPDFTDPFDLPDFPEPRQVKFGSGNDYDIRLKISTDQGATWTDSEFVNSNAFSDSGDDESSVSVMDQDRNIIIVWESFDTLGNTIGGDSDIVFARASLAGFTELLTPNGGEKWKRGTKKTIKWVTDQSPTQKVRLNLLRNGNKVATIAANTKNDGKFKWKVPNNLPKGGGYQVEILPKSTVGDNDRSYYTFSLK